MLCGALLSLFGLSVLYICVWRWDYLPVMSEMLNEPDMVQTSVFPWSMAKRKSRIFSTVTVAVLPWRSRPMLKNPDSDDPLSQGRFDP